MTSQARMVTWSPQSRATASGLALIWPAKDAADTLDYAFNIQPWLDDAGGVTVASIAASVSGDLTAGTAASAGGVIICRFSGGTNNVLYVVTYVVTMSDGEIKKFTVVLPVWAGAIGSMQAAPGPQPGPATAIVTSSVPYLLMIQPNLAAFIAGLPTSLPSTSGVLWNAGGMLCVS